MKEKKENVSSFLAISTYFFSKNSTFLRFIDSNNLRGFRSLKSFENITFIRKKLPESSSLLKIGFNSSSSSRFCLLISSTVAFSLCESNQSFFSSQNLFPLNCQEKRTQDFTKTCLAKPLLSLQTKKTDSPTFYIPEAYKSYPFWEKSPYIDHYRKYPPFRN